MITNINDIESEDPIKLSSNDILATCDTANGLCKLARKLGYKDPHGQLSNRDGSCVGDLLYFLDDNPGVCEAIINWVSQNFATDDSVEDDEESMNE